MIFLKKKQKYHLKTADPFCLVNKLKRTAITEKRMYCRRIKKKVIFFGIVIFLTAFLLNGCADDGSDGATGPAGPSGPPGPPGDNGSITETCIICHGSGKEADIAVAHPDPMEKSLAVKVTAVSDTSNGKLKVFFTLADGTGNGITGMGLDGNRFYISDIVPAGTPTASWGTWDTDYLERWADERDGEGYPTGTWTEIGDGRYAYTFETAPGSAEALEQAPDFDISHTQRLVMRIDGSEYGYTRAVGIQDFTINGSITLLSPQRVLAPIDGCKKCHGPEMDKAAHASSYPDTRACVQCHSPIGNAYGEQMQESGAWLSNLIHKIHAAIPMEAFESRIGGLGYGAVTYPRDIRNCVACHTGSDHMTDAWKTNPTAEVCGSCHVKVDFITGENHEGGVQTDNNFCAVCHPPNDEKFGGSVTAAHSTAPVGVNVPEFDAALTLTAPINGSYYKAGEAPLVTVTPQDHETGLNIDPAIYTTGQDTAGVPGGGLHVASLYVYGPRARSVPVLATDTMTDPAFDEATSLPVQGHSLFKGGDDPLIKTNRNGFEYQLLPIPDNMKSGTYMVRVRIGDFGRVGPGDYRIESFAFTTIQIRTDSIEEKVAGNACYDCHGTGTAPFHDERHAVVFNTDECLSCHDQSGNHAVPLANRVHAVHDANSSGDIYNLEGGSRDWSGVTYPQDIARCVTCHNSGKTTYKTLPFMMPCAGCHADDPVILGHMRQKGGPY